MRRALPLLVLAGLIGLVLAACAQSASSTDVIQDYLKAKVSSDEDKLISLSCKAWEAQAMRDATSFESVKAELQNMSCKKSGTEGDYTLVTCEGQIVVEYDGQNREFNLNETLYRVLKEDGEWKMCGEQPAAP